MNQPYGVLKKQNYGFEKDVDVLESLTGNSLYDLYLVASYSSTENSHFSFGTCLGDMLGLEIT